MSSLRIFFIAVIAIVIPKNEANVVSVQDLDVDRILDLVQQQQQRANRRDQSTSSEDSSSSDSDLDRVERTGGDTIADVISQIVSKRNNKQADRDEKNNRGRANNVDRAEQSEAGRSNDIAYILGQVLSKNLNSAGIKKQSNNESSKKIVSRLLGNKNIDDSLDGYSKIYILLNPDGVQKTKNSNSGISQLISKILSLNSSRSKRDRQEVEGSAKQRSYKVSVLQDPAGRRRGSREMYAPGDSDEDKPTKRGRNAVSGGGHTAIPYIRHRGENIYEREN